MRAGHDVFSQRQTTSSSSRCSALPHTGQRVGICHGCAVRRRAAGSASTTFGMTSPPFSISDAVAFAQVLPRDVLGVVQRRHRDGRSGEQDRLEHRVRRHRAGAADVDVDLPQHRRRLLRRELERGRPARKLRGRAEPLAQREVVDLDRRRRRCRSRARAASRPTRRRRRRPRRCRRSARQCGSTGSPHSRIAVSASAWRRKDARSSSGRRRPDRRTRAGRASRPAPDPGCASCRPRRFADWQTAARPPPRARGSCARTPRAAGRPRRGPRSGRPGPPRSASGIARIVRTLAVTSSPREPSPRVAPRTSRPSS